MKPFVLALCLVILITAFVIVDVIVTDNFTDGITSDLLELPEEFEKDANLSERLDKIVVKWERARKYLAVTVNYSYITAVNVSIESLVAATTVEDDVDYCTHRKNLLLALENLRKFGSISLETIF